MLDDKKNENRNDHENEPTIPQTTAPKVLKQTCLVRSDGWCGTWRSAMFDDKSDDNCDDHKNHLIDENDDALKGVLGFGW